MIEILPQETLDKITKLSPRQWEVFLCLMEGRTLSEIADIPGHRCSTKTLETHIAHLKEKLGVETNMMARKIAVEFGVHIRVNNLTIETLHETRRIETTYRKIGVGI